ncbi:MAG: DUF1624 domain-containing protein [Burkholderiaceae bacterium]|nr:DUF1624 domain-containing protein [Burkholderiaceae bacterium]
MNLPDAPAAPAAAAARLDTLDALRGLAMLWMTAYHLCFDLHWQGHWRQDFYQDPFWIWQRNAIVGLFLYTAGFSQAVAVARGQGWPRFGRRWGQIAGCALLVSAASLWLFPHSFIYFGVLHGMAVMLPITRAALLRPRMGAACALAAMGVAVLALAALASAWLTRPESAWAAAWLDSRWLNWLGLITQKPVTEDYVPIAPWLGVLLLGAAAGRWRMQKRQLQNAALARVTARNPLTRPLAALGRWSLPYYMLHQPVLLGTLMLSGWLAGRM